MIEELIVKSREEIKIMTDPYRVEIINIMKNHGSPMTVKEIADKMGDPHGKVYYHIKKFEKIAAVVIHHTKNIKGITAKYYAINFKELIISPSASADPDLTADFAINQSLNMVGSLYDSSKKDFLNYYKKFLTEANQEANRKDLSPEEKAELEKKDDPKKYGILENSVLHFTGEEYENFIHDLKSLISKYDNNDTTKPYKKNFFFTLYSTN